MYDYGAEWTDAAIQRLENRIHRIYSDAAKEVQEKFNRFIEKFKRDDAIFRAKVESGEITKVDYAGWLAGQVFQGKRWRAQLEALTDTLTRTNEVAMDFINSTTPGTLAMNANWAAYSIEKEIGASMGFGLYDTNTVKRLLVDEPALLPPARVDIPKDQRWNMSKIRDQITKGIITGAPLEEIAASLRRVAIKNENASRTHARTAMTGAQNAGRMVRYKEAQNMGIDMEREWLATLDSHTRTAHRDLDGQRRPLEEPFEWRGMTIMYPGDPSAPPRLVYNCRCTLVSHVLDYPDENVKRRPNEQQLGDATVQKPIPNMTYREWEKWKKGVKK